MNLLHWFFNIINPGKSRNWLSVRYHTWEQARRKKRNEYFKSSPYETGTLFFDVKGAGQIAIGKDCHGMCGGAVGFSFGVSWGLNGFCGGIIGRDQAKRMAQFILDQCSDITETEQEERERMRFSLPLSK